VASSNQKQQGLFGSGGIQLTDEEASSPVTTKFLRYLNATQEATINTLRSFESQYYDKRQECEVIKKEKEIIERELKAKKDTENLQKVMISVGSIILGSLKFVEGQPWYLIAVLGLLSVLLIIGGMFPILRIGAAK
jgi:hypothetical protein